MDFFEQKERKNTGSSQLDSSQTSQKKYIFDQLKASYDGSADEVRFCQNTRLSQGSQASAVVQKMKWIWSGKKWIPMYDTNETPPNFNGYERGAVCISEGYDSKKAKEDSPKFDPKEFALFKLLGEPSDKPSDNYTKRKVLLEKVSQAKIYVNYTDSLDSILENSTILTLNSDFPGKVYEKNKTLYVINIHGMGRKKEVESYLQYLTLAEIEIIQGKQSDEEIIISKLGKKTTDLLENQNSPVHLVIMPLSTLAQINREEYEVKWYNTEFPNEWIIHNSSKDVYFIADIKWANGSLVAALINVLCEFCGISSVDLYGSAGSLNPEISSDMLVAPEGPFYSLDEEYRENVQVAENAARLLQGLTKTKGHGNVSSILEEDDLGVRELKDNEVDTIDMEGYHLVKKLNEMQGEKLPLRMIFRIYDVITSEKSNISIKPQRDGETWKKKQETDLLILKLFNLE